MTIHSTTDGIFLHDERFAYRDDTINLFDDIIDKANFIRKEAIQEINRREAAIDVWTPIHPATTTFERYYQTVMHNHEVTAELMMIDYPTGFRGQWICWRLKAPYMLPSGA